MIRAQKRNRVKHDPVDHAIAIQQRRIDAGKRGYAKAVRRWLKASATMYGVYKEALPVKWTR